MKKILIIDNILSKKEQEEIEKTLISESQIRNFNWFFIDDVTKIDNKHQKRPGFCHFFFKNNLIYSNFFGLIKSLAEKISKKIKLKNSTIIEARSFLQLPLNKNFIGEGVDTPHLDRTTPHIVFLYYVTDSDGDTVIYNYKSKNEKDIPYFEDIKELKRIKPKKGRVVVFDGLYWHTAEQPTKDVRCIINFNISNGNNDI